MTDIIANLLALITRFAKENYKSWRFWISASIVSLLLGWILTSCTMTFQIAKNHGSLHEVSASQSTSVDSTTVNTSFLNR